MDLDEGRLDDVFAEFSATTPGVVLGVVVEGELVVARGYGSADLEHGVPMTPAAVFDIASTSKQFTAAVVLCLSDEGVLGLDDAVCDHLPVLPRHTFGDVTVRHLVHHTSGIPDYLTLMLLTGRAFDNHYAADELVDLVARQRGLDFPPGTSYSYSNSGYLLLAELVQATTGQSLRTAADERLFAPAGMSSTFMRDDFTQVVPDRAIGYTARADGSWGTDAPLFDVLGDGAVCTTVGDLARWDRQFYDCTLPVARDFTTRLTSTATLADGTPLDYAFGLVVGSHGTHRRVQHKGVWGGYRSQFARFPDARTSVIVLSNASTAAVDDYVGAVADLVLDDDHRTALSNHETDRALSTEDPPDADVDGAEALHAATGRYRSAELGADLVVSLHDGVLRSRFGWGPTYVLTPAAGGRLVGDEHVIQFELEDGLPVAATVTTTRARAQRFLRV